MSSKETCLSLEAVAVFFSLFPDSSQIEQDITEIYYRVTIVIEFCIKTGLRIYEPAVIYVEYGERQAVSNFIHAALFPVVFPDGLGIHKCDNGISICKAALQCHICIISGFQLISELGQDLF